MNNNELFHYGVKGMKWGIRRYQNSDGTLTPEGRRKAKYEYNKDNETAFELGKAATITGYAAAKSIKRTAKLEDRLSKKYEKDPDGLKRSTQSLHKKYIASSMATLKLTKEYTAASKKAEEHCKSLIDKYGEDAVASIAYKDVKLPKGKYPIESFKIMNEDVHTVGDYAVSAAVSVGSAVVSMLMGSPFTIVSVPRTAKSMANQVEYDNYRSNLEAQRKGRMG